MREISIERLIEWLGPNGAIAGLEGSDATVSELLEIAIRYGCPVDKKAKRGDIIIELVNGNSVRVDKTTDELLAMSCDDLETYFKNRKVSRTELLRLLLEFDIRPAASDKLKLVEFAARELSDVGMYQRIAKGAR